MNLLAIDSKLRAYSKLSHKHIYFKAYKMLKLQTPIFYVYRITNKIENKHYYGSKTAKDAHPSQLGITYFSSSTDKNFISDQKLNPCNYKYKIVKIFNNKIDCITFENILHEKFNVARNEKFYNKSNQCRGGFLCSNYNSVVWAGRKHSSGAKRKMSVAKKDRVVCKNIVSGETLGVCREEFLKNENLVGIRSGVKNSEELNVKISTSLTGRIFTTEHKANLKKANNSKDYTKIYTKEIRKKMSERNKNKKMSINTKKKCSHTYGVFDTNNNLIYSIEYDLKSFCKEHNLPYTRLLHSVKTKCKFFENISSRTQLYIDTNAFGFCIGWKAEILKKRESQRRLSDL